MTVVSRIGSSGGETDDVRHSYFIREFIRELEP